MTAGNIYTDKSGNPQISLTLGESILILISSKWINVKIGIALLRVGNNGGKLLKKERFPRQTGMLRPYAMEEEGTLSRTPLVDMVDRGDRYRLRLEIPGIDKDKIQLNATDDSIEISGEQSGEESTEDKWHNYIYNERSYRSFYRSIPIPEEILPSKITARMDNGILRIDVPKKAPSRPAGGSTRIEIG
jgi:HSP20 family protein